MSDQLAAIAITLLSAVMFAVTFVLVRVGVKTASSRTALWLTLSVNVVVLWSWSLIACGWQFDHWWQWRYFFLAGIFAPLLGRLFQFLAMARLGSNIATPLTLTHPVVTLVLASVFLGEHLSSLGLAGALLVIVGSIVVGSQGGQDAIQKLTQTPRRYLLLPAIGSFSYGTSMVFRKVGIDMVSGPVTAAAVTSLSSWLFASLYVAGSGGFGKIRCTRKELGYFAGAGIFSSLGTLLFYAGLQYADLVFVAPLAATTPLFALVLTYIFIRGDEIFTPKVITGTIATVAGVALVTVFGHA